MEQRTDEWIAARLGKVTASRVADVMARTKTGYGATRANYMAELICERLTGVAQDTFVSPAMQWGTNNEPLARAAYEAALGDLVEETGFVPHDEVMSAGASPDGLVGTDGLVEIKCPNTATHIDTLLGDEIPNKYMLQMQWQMACTGRKWCDFVSYDPRMPANMQLFIKRVQRDEAVIADIKKEVSAFLAELDQRVAKLNERYQGAA